MNADHAAADRRFVRWSVLVSIVLAVLAVCGLWRYAQLRPALKADAALDAAFARNYDQMQASLDALADMDEPKRYYQAVLDCAAMADYHGDAQQALDILSQPQQAEDEAYAAFAPKAEEQAAICIYHQAMTLYEAGDYARAARTAAQARSYEPAMALYELAQNAWQASQPTPAPTPVPTPTPAPTATPAPQVTQQPEPTPQPFALWPEGRVAAGIDHTVVLLDEGTVRAFGDNTYGQLDVEGWENIVSVAAGAYHTLGLTADGRVLACGDNAHQQADVGFFSGVRAIAAGDYASFLLLENGQVMATGYLDYPFLDELTGAEALWAGSYGLLVRTADGLHASHASLALDASCRLAAVSRGYAVGADADGNTHSTTFIVPAWTGVCRLAAGENAVIGLTETGQVLSHVFDERSRADFSFDQPVLAVAAGPEHYAFLLADGTLDIRFSTGETRHYDLN